MFDRSASLRSIAGLVHGFTDREGGASEGRFATLNLGRRWGDDPVAVEENYARLGRAADFAPERLVTVRQVHGAAVAWAHEVSASTEADAVCCRREDERVVGVLTADCVPVLLADREGRVAAAVHSGWRGTVADVVGATVAALGEAGVEPRALVAAIGPCIEARAFEVGPEVAAQFPPAFVDASGPRPHVDLVATVRAQLCAAGVPDDAIDRVGGCTHDTPARWFSYRRDGAGIGQMLAFVGFGASARRR
jgi:YfiH family protein